LVLMMIPHAMPKWLSCRCTVSLVPHGRLFTTYGTWQCDKAEHSGHEVVASPLMHWSASCSLQCIQNKALLSNKIALVVPEDDAVDEHNYSPSHRVANKSFVRKGTQLASSVRCPGAAATAESRLMTGGQTW